MDRWEREKNEEKCDLGFWSFGENPDIGDTVRIIRAQTIFSDRNNENASFLTLWMALPASNHSKTSVEVGGNFLFPTSPCFSPFLAPLPVPIGNIPFLSGSGISEQTGLRPCSYLLISRGLQLLRRFRPLFQLILLLPLFLLKWKVLCFQMRLQWSCILRHYLPQHQTTGPCFFSSVFFFNLNCNCY